MHRSSVLVAWLVALLTAGLAPVAAQDASPASSGSLLAELGYPEFRITVTDDGAAAPTEVAAGRYLMVLENGSASEVDATFVKLPEGQTLETLDEGAGDRPPDWLYESEIAGGTVAPAGGVGMAVIDLTAGEWFFDVSRQDEDEGGEATPATEGADEEQLLLLTVTGDAGSPVAAEEPAGAIAVGMQDFAFHFPEPVPAGPQIWKVTNTGEQPHFIFLAKGPDDLTRDDVLAILEADATGGTPPPGVPNPETDFSDVGETSVLSSGKSMWLEFDLAPGTYVAICFFPDRETGAPHAAMGMVQLFTVSAA